MNKKTIYMMTGLILVVVMLLSACAPAAQPPAAKPEATQPPAAQPEATQPPAPKPEATSAPAKEVINITMWDIPESEPYTKWWEAYVKSWNAANPDIQVKMEVFETEPYKTKLIGALASGTSADIFYQMAGGDSYKVFREGKAAPLDNLLKTDRFTEAGLSKCRVDGKIACMPLYFAPSFWYYNKAMFDKAGVDPQKWGDPTQPTWEEFLAAAEALKAKGIVPIALGNGDSWPGMMIYASIHSRIGGNDDFYNAMNGKNGVTFTSPSFVKAGALVQELAKKGYLPEGFNGIGGEQKYALFTQGQGAMIFQGSWMLGYIKDGTPAGFEYGIFNTPKFADGKADSQADIQGGADALWISASSKHPEAAAKFLNGFTEKETALSFVKDTENISVIKGVFDGATIPGSIPKMVELIGKAPNFSPWWDVELPAAVTEELLNNTQALWASEITPEEFAAKLQKATGR